MDPQEPLTCVLGEARIIESASERRQRVLAYADDVFVGLAAFELLYGPRGEFSIGVREPPDPEVAVALLEALCDQARQLELRTLQASIGREQREFVRHIPFGVQKTGVLSISLDRSDSVTTTHEVAQDARMANPSGRSIIVV